MVAGGSTRPDLFAKGTGMIFIIRSLPLAIHAGRSFFRRTGEIVVGALLSSRVRIGPLGNETRGGECSLVHECLMRRTCFTNPTLLAYHDNMKTFTLAFFQRCGNKGGSVRSKAKAIAARKNGRKGGRPRKHKEPK